MVTHAKLPLFGAIACVSLLIAQSFSATAARAMEDEVAAPQRSAEPAAAYTRLYESIMIRQGPDGKSYGADALDPLLVWHPSKFLIEGKSRERLIAALDAFASQPSRKFEIYTDVQRAVMQRLLWAVFDFTAKRGGNASEGKRAIQQKLVPIVRRLSLSRDAINALPDNFAATVKADRYSRDPDPKALFKPFFPAGLFEPKGPWICLTTSYLSAKSPLPAKTHSEDQLHRSAFNIFIRLPGGRDQTLQYIKDLADFRDHWTTEGPRRPILSITNVSRNLKTPKFPAGTQFAIVRQALLISNAGKLVVSPLIESVQMRAYLKRHSKAVSEFLMEPTKLIVGEAILRARRVDERGFKLFLAGGSDPLDPESGRSLRSDRSILGHCNICHSSSGIHSVASRSERFNLEPAGLTFSNPHVVPPQFLEGKPEDVWKGTIREKRATYSWGLLQGLWHR